MKYLATILIIIIIKLMACRNSPAMRTGFEGKPLPEFTMQLADSTTFLNTKSIPSDKPVALFYFSPECPYCRVQMEDMIRNMDQLKDIRLYVLTAYPYEEMKRFYDHYELYKYSNLKVGVDHGKSFGKYYNISSVPYTAVYDNKKLLNQAYAGVITSQQLKSTAEQ